MGYGLTNRLLDKFGVHTRQLVINAGGAPVAPPLAIYPSEPPTGTAAEGFCYWDDDAHELTCYNGSAWEAVGASPSVDLDVAGDVTIGDDLTLNSTGAILQMGPTATNPIVLTQSANTLTLATGDTFAVTTADKLTLGGVIVPATLYFTYQYDPLATITEYDLMIAKRALTVVSIDVVPSTLQGGSLTGTVVKATSTATPVKTTTPMHTADAINFNTGAYTVQPITLTVTGADLALAAGERIGLDLSAAMTAGKGAITIGYKYT